ncbi:MAG: DUF600 family protein [Clostridiales bacterium]|nr:DUF600 family protein [Clostridiales bacterium]
MKTETIIYDEIKKVIPTGSRKTVFFAEVTETSYEIYFYAFTGEKPVQCYTLAEQGELDENELDAVFEAVSNIIKQSKAYDKNKMNIATITVDHSGVYMDMEYYELNARMFILKKQWEQKYIMNAE